MITFNTTDNINRTDKPADNQNSAGRRKRGRPTGKARCVVQLRCRAGGKVWSLCSYTLEIEPNKAMQLVQQTFHDYIRHGGSARRPSD